MSRNILITGATGKTGAYTVNALLRHGKSRLTQREPWGSFQLRADGAAILHGGGGPYACLRSGGISGRPH